MKGDHDSVDNTARKSSSNLNCEKNVDLKLNRLNEETREKLNIPEDNINNPSYKETVNFHHFQPSDGSSKNFDIEDIINNQHATKKSARKRRREDNESINLNSINVEPNEKKKNIDEGMNYPSNTKNVHFEVIESSNETVFRKLDIKEDYAAKKSSRKRKLDENVDINLNSLTEESNEKMKLSIKEVNNPSNTKNSNFEIIQSSNETMFRNSDIKEDSAVRKSPGKRKLEENVSFDLNSLNEEENRNMRNPVEEVNNPINTKNGHFEVIQSSTGNMFRNSGIKVDSTANKSFKKRKREENVDSDHNSLNEAENGNTNGRPSEEINDSLEGENIIQRHLESSNGSSFPSINYCTTILGSGDKSTSTTISFIGPNAISIAQNGVSIGLNGVSINTNAILIGPNGISIGPNRVSITPNSVSIGQNGDWIGPNGVSIGHNGVSIGPNGVSIGPNASNMVMSISCGGANLHSSMRLNNAGLSNNDVNLQPVSDSISRLCAISTGFSFNNDYFESDEDELEGWSENESDDSDEFLSEDDFDEDESDESVEEDSDDSNEFQSDDDFDEDESDLEFKN